METLSTQRGTSRLPNQLQQGFGGRVQPKAYLTLIELPPSLGVANPEVAYKVEVVQYYLCEF
jgi:hypothetical protein